MTITLELKPEVEDRLRENAERAGLPLEQYLVEWIEHGSYTPAANGAYPPGSLAEIFAQWQAEDATDDPEELRKAEEELEELKANLNANRTACGEEPLFP